MTIKPRFSWFFHGFFPLEISTSSVSIQPGTRSEPWPGSRRQLYGPTGGGPSGPGSPWEMPWEIYDTHDGSFHGAAILMVCHGSHQYTQVMLAYNIYTYTIHGSVMGHMKTSGKCIERIMENMHGKCWTGLMYGNILVKYHFFLKYQHVGKHMGNLWLASMWENDWTYLEQYRRS